MIYWDFLWQLRIMLHHDYVSTVYDFLHKYDFVKIEISLFTSHLE